MFAEKRRIKIDKPFSFPTTIKGIPCRIRVLSYLYHPGDPTSWDSPFDYFGGWEIEWELLDRKGYHAPWLERKLTEEDGSEIEQRIIEEVEVDEY